jgi:guanine nucleotide-binding protein alpha-1 subunit
MIMFLDFQLTYARKEWSEERAGWRAVIFLNLVRNVNLILSHLENEMADIPYDPEEEELQEIVEVPRPARALPRLKFSEKHRLLKERLAPLATVQDSLESNLGSASLDPRTASELGAAPFDELDDDQKPLPEFSINSSNGWKTALEKFRTLRSAPTSRADSSANDASSSPVTLASRRASVRHSEDDIAEIIASHRDDIKTLWEDDIVGETLMRRKVRLEDRPG